jgi:LacI family transcriptional regulator
MEKAVDAATMKEVAERAGVALSSVSRVLNNHPDVSDEMRRRVLGAAESLNYQPDLLAQGLRRGVSNTVGFVVRDISNPVFADIVKAAEDTLREAGYSMLLTNSEGDPNLDAQYIQLFRQRRADGLILSLGSETNPATLEALRSLRSPLVLLDREVPSIAASAVYCDHQPGVRAAIDHMLELGHERIGFILGPLEIRNSRERLHGYVDAHRVRGVTVDDRLVRIGYYTEEFAYRETQDLLGMPEPPTALLSGGGQLALGMLSALHDQGIRVGRDIAFVTCDEIQLMRLFNPPISVVARNTVRMGQLAAQLLLDILVEGKPPRIEVLPTEYISRGSTIPPPS